MIKIVLPEWEAYKIPYESTRTGDFIMAKIDVNDIMEALHARRRKSDILIGKRKQVFIFPYYFQPRYKFIFFRRYNKKFVYFFKHSVWQVSKQIKDILIKLVFSPFYYYYEDYDKRIIGERGKEGVITVYNKIDNTWKTRTVMRKYLVQEMEKEIL